MPTTDRTKLTDQDIEAVRLHIRRAAEWLDGQHDDEAIAHGCQPRPYSIGAARSWIRAAEERFEVAAKRESEAGVQ